MQSESPSYSCTQSILLTSIPPDVWNVGKAWHGSPDLLVLWMKVVPTVETTIQEFVRLSPLINVIC